MTQTDRLPLPFTIIECERPLTVAATDAAYQSTRRGEPSLIIQRNPKSITLKWDCEICTGDTWRMGIVPPKEMEFIDRLIARSDCASAMWTNSSGLIRNAKGSTASALIEVLKHVRVQFQVSRRERIA